MVMAIPLTEVEATEYHSVTLSWWLAGSVAEILSVKLRLGDALVTPLAGQGLPAVASSESATTTMRSFAWDVVSPGSVNVLPAMAASPPTTPSTLKDGEGVGSVAGVTEAPVDSLGAGEGTTGDPGAAVGEETGVVTGLTPGCAGGTIEGIEGPKTEERAGGVKTVGAGTGTPGATGVGI